MAKNNNLKDYLVDLYQGIASRKPNASKNPQDFRSEIENLVFTSDADAAASDIRAGKTAYVNDVKITGTIKDYDDTYQEGSVPYDMLQAKVDQNNSCAYLFYGYSGTSDNFIASFSKLNTSNVTNMSYMFYNCINLTTLPQLDTSSCVEINYMFYSCINLRTIDMTHLRSEYSSINGFAVNCYSLTKLIVRNMDKIPKLHSNAFANAYHFNGTTDSEYNPNGLKDARIYVPDDKVEALKAEKTWAAYADIIVPLSTLEE